MQEAYRPPRSCSVSQSDLPTGYGGGTIPHPVLMGVPIFSADGRGVPPSSPNRGTPIQFQGGTPSSPNRRVTHPVPIRDTPIQCWQGVPQGTPTRKDGDTLPVRKDEGTPVRKDGSILLSGRFGYPSPIGKDRVPPGVWTDTQTENMTFPHPLDAGGNRI